MSQSVEYSLGVTVTLISGPSLKQIVKNGLSNVVKYRSIDVSHARSITYRVHYVLKMVKHKPGA